MYSRHNFSSGGSGKGTVIGICIVIIWVCLAIWGWWTLCNYTAGKVPSGEWQGLAKIGVWLVMSWISFVVGWFGFIISFLIGGTIAAIFD